MSKETYYENLVSIFFQKIHFIFNCVFWTLRVIEKERHLTQSYDKNPYTNKKIKLKAKTRHKNIIWLKQLWYEINIFAYRKRLWLIYHVVYVGNSFAVEIVWLVSYSIIGSIILFYGIPTFPIIQLNFDFSFPRHLCNRTPFHCGKIIISITEKMTDNSLWINHYIFLWAHQCWMHRRIHKEAHFCCSAFFKISSYIKLLLLCVQWHKGVGEGGQGGGGHVAPHFQKWGAQVGLCPPPLLGRANVLISLFAHILWLKTQFFQNFLGSLRSLTLIDQYFLNFANLKL